MTKDNDCVCSEINSRNCPVCQNAHEQTQYEIERDEASKQSMIGIHKYNEPILPALKAACDLGYSYAQKTMIPMSEVEKLIKILSENIRISWDCATRDDLTGFQIIFESSIDAIANYYQFIENRNKTNNKGEIE